MPLIKSAKKRVRVAAKAKARNSYARRNLRQAFKDFTAALASGKSEAIIAAERKAVSALDTAAKKNVIHRNKAARQKARLSAQAKAQGVKLSKTAAKKTPAKAPAKKTATTKRAK